MNVIGGYARLIHQNETADTDEELVEATGAIIEAASGLASLSGGAQIISDVLEPEGTSRRISILAEDTMLKTESTYPGAVVWTGIEAGFYARVDSRVGATLDELVMNTLKHDGRMIRISMRRTEADDSKLVVRVDDGGPRIFDEE